MHTLVVHKAAGNFTRDFLQYVRHLLQPSEPSLCDASQERAAARQQREIGNVREGLVEGGDALAKGFYRGFTGLINKPLQGAKAGVGGKARSCAGDRCLLLGRSVLSKAASDFFLLLLYLL